jgi:NAD-dependent dihydropyrimidine dehydrogenase PreA subunit
MVKISVDAEKCTGCGSCVDICPVGVYELKEDSKKKAVPTNTEQCLACRACEMSCPNQAIKVLD